MLNVCPLEQFELDIIEIDCQLIYRAERLLQ